MAMSDYGVCVTKNGKAMRGAILECPLVINGCRLTMSLKGFDVRYAGERLFEFFDDEHPFRKIIRHVNGVYIEIKPHPYDSRISIYIRDQGDSYRIEAGYGIR